MIFVEEDPVLFAGDVVISHRFLAAQPMSSIANWLTTIDELAALEPVRVVPSHESTGDVALIARDREFLLTVQTRVEALKREGKTVEEAIAPKYSEWGT